MQASQSNNASDLLMLNLNAASQLEEEFSSGGLSNFPPESSSFLSPLQAARRYVGGQRDLKQRDGGLQRGNVWQKNDPESEMAGRGGLQRTGQQSAGSSERQNRTLYEAGEDDSRARDRRLERSLYEGHSIEAGLNYEAGETGVAEGAAEAGARPVARSGKSDSVNVDRVALASSDGTESLFRYAAPSSSPDPDVVRGAISRLARESELRTAGARLPSFHSGGARDIGKTEFTGSKPVQPLAFADVARKVWNSDAARTSNAEGAESEANLTAHGPGPEIAIEMKVAASAEPTVGSKTNSTSQFCDTEAKPALAHDACNLLSALALYSELLGSPGVLEEQYKHYASELKLLAHRSQALIHRLLQAAETVETAGAVAGHRIASNQEGHPKTNVADLLERWSGLLSSLGNGRFLVVSGAYAATPVPVRPEALERILVNLVRNAATATRDGGAIRIGFGVEAAEGLPEVVRRPAEAIQTSAPTQSAKTSGLRLENEQEEQGSGSAMVLTVDDSGCGMTDGQIRVVLDQERSVEVADGTDRPHTSTDTPSVVSTEGVQGRRRGLGLQIVRELVAASGGTLAIRSRPGRGTRIELRWPVNPAEFAGAAPRPAKIQQAEPQPVTVLTGAFRETVPVDRSRQVARNAGSSPIDGATSSIGPDGFSETELRAMMLRLHRARPQERSPLSRRQTSRLVGKSGSSEQVRGLGGVASAGHGDTAYGARRVDPAHQDEAAKGAIAC